MRFVPAKIRELSKEKKHGTFIVPMLAHIGEKAFSDPDWIFEIKWDGYRAVAELKGTNVKLYSRNGLSFESKYAAVTAALKKMNIKAVLDGEIVILDKQNRPNFQLLQHYPDIEEPHQIVYYVFDLLELDGKKLYDTPLLERKKILKKILGKKNAFIQYCDHVEADGKGFFKVMVKNGFEGMMAKEKNSLYHPGKRSSEWLKIRNHKTEEAIICGYTAPQGSRKFFGSLILGMYKEDKPVYIGNVGTGFDEKSLEELYVKMQKLKRKTSPFAQPIMFNAPVTWIKPALVCNIKYTEWTRDRQLRHPVFMGLRIDKKASEVKIKKTKS